MEVFVNLLLLILLLPVIAIITFFGLKLFLQEQYKSKLSTTDLNKLSFLLVKTSISDEKSEKVVSDFLHSIHKVIPENSVISLEISLVNQFLSFYLVVQNNLKDLVESQLYAQFPNAEILESGDHLINFGEKISIVQIRLKRNSVSPLNTHLEIDEDILKGLSSFLSKSESTDKAVIQILLKKVGSNPFKRGIFPLYLSFTGKKTSYPKLSSDLFKGQINIAYFSENYRQSQERIKIIISLFKNLKSKTNEFKTINLKDNKFNRKQLYARQFLSFDLFTRDEISTIYHFPSKGTASNIIQSTSRRGPAPSHLPYANQTDQSEISLFGETNFQNDGKTFGIKRIDRRRHLYVVGKTGSGKSRLLELLLISDIQNGEGCCLLDPHGDLADELLMYIPKNRIKDVVYINPADRDFPIGFNPLEAVEDFEMRQHLSVFFISIFKKLFAATWNPRMEHLIRYITLALLETPDSNILGIPRILSDTKYRQKVVMQIKDPVVKSFWTNEFATYNQQFSNEAVVPILNKVGQFISNPIVRNMIGQQKNNLNFEKFMNEGKIVLINISKGKLGDENAALLGSMFITKIQQAALARAKMKEEDRRDFYFYVDEFQNFATDAFSSILSEARKYHLDLTIAHQYIAQLPDEVKATAFGNVGTIISFAVGGDDAKYLAKEFSPTFTPDDMINLNTREMYIKMSVDGKLTTPFSANTISIPKPESDYSIEIVDKSRVTYGKNRIQVENEIERWTSGKEVKSSSVSNSEEFPEPII